MAGKSTVRIEVLGEERGVSKLFKTIDDGAGKATGLLGKLGGAFADVGKIAGGFVLGNALLKLPGAIGGVISAASDMAESQNKVNVVFGDSAETINEFAANSARDFGIAKGTALEYAGTLGSLFRGMQIGEQTSADMSKQLLALSADMASFNNASPEEALEALRAGLIGESEPLRRFGVNLSAARIEAEAFAIGLAKPTENAEKITAAQIKVEKATKAAAEAQKKYGADSIQAREASNALALAQEGLEKAMEGQKVELTEAQKAQAAYSLIMKDTALAQGDFARTSTGLANSQRIIKATIADMAADIGTRLLPYVEILIGFFAARLPGAIDTAIAFFGRLIGAVSPVVAFLRQLGAPNGAIEQVVNAISRLLIGLDPAEWSSSWQETIRTTVEILVGQVLPIIRQFVAQTQALIVGTLIPAFQAAAATILPVLQSIIGFIRDNWQATLAGAAGVLLGVLVPAFVAWAASAAAAAAATIAALAPVLLPLAAIGAAAAGLYLAWDKNFLGIRDVTAAVADFIGQKVEAIVAAVARFWTEIEPQARAAWQNIQTAVTTAASAIQAIVTAVFGAIAAFLSAHGAEIQAILEGAWRVIQGVVQVALAVIEGIIKAALAVIAGDWDAAWQAIRDMLDGIWAGIQSIISGQLEILKGAFSIALDAIKLLWSAGWDALIGAFSAAWSGVERAIDAGIAGIKAAFSGAASWLLEAGKDIVRGLINGMDAMLDSVKNKARDIANAAKDAVTGALGIRSPSTVMAGYGENIVEGLIDGIEEKVPALESVLGGLSRMIGRWGQQALGQVGEPKIGDSVALEPTYRGGVTVGRGGSTVRRHDRPVGDYYGAPRDLAVRGGTAAITLDGEKVGQWMDKRRVRVVKQRAGLIAS